MNSLLRITIEIAVKQAQELAALVKTIEGLGAKGRSSASGLKAVADAVKQTAKQAKGVEEAQKKVLANQKAIETASRTIIGNMKNVVEQFKRNMISAEEAAKRVEALGAKRRDPKGRFMAQTPDVVDAQRRQLDAIGKIARQKIREEEAEKIRSIKRILAQEETGRIRSFAARRAISRLGEGAAPGSAVDIQKARAYRALDAREIARTSKVQRDDQKRLEASIRSMKTEMSNAMREFNSGLIDAEAASKRIKGIWQKPNADPSIQNKIAQGGEVSRQAKINLAKIESARIKAIKKDEIDYLNKISKEYANGQITYSQMVTRTRYNAGASGNPEVRAAAEANIQKASIDRLRAFTQQAAGIEARFRQQKISFTDAQAQIAKVREGIDNTYTANSIKQAQARTRASDALNAINIRNDKSATDQLRKIEQDFIKGKVDYQKSLLAAGAIKTGLNSTPAIKKAADQSMLNLTQAREVKIHSDTVKQVEGIRQRHYSRLISFAQANDEINKIEKNYLNSGLSAQKIADDLSIARLKMRNTEERRLVEQHMNELLLIRKRAAVGQISMGEAQKQVSAIGSMHPAGSKVNVQAASEYKRIGDAMKRATDAGSALNGSLTTQRRSLVDVGKNMMWTGRQLEYTFTLPIARAAKALFELQKESSIQVTKIAKVYGDATGAANSFSQSEYALGKSMAKVTAGQITDSYKLGKAFRLLSDSMGVQISKVEEIASKWAAAGYQGGALFKATKMTMQAMVVGDIENVDDAFNSLIQTKQGYRLTLEETAHALAVLNKTENITAANFTDLTAGFARSASAASQAGVKVEELAGMLATLVPAAGSAETVGQGLKTVISRIMSPTQAFKDELAQVGIIWNDTFNSMTATQRLTTLATKFAELDKVQKNQLETTFSGRYQLNKASLLLEDLALYSDEATRSQSTFGKVLEATNGELKDGSDVMSTYAEEIQKYLDSPAGKIAILKTRIQNLGNDIFARLMPIFEKILTYVLKFLMFLDMIGPKGKQFILIGIAMFALLGPLSRIMGAFLQFGEITGWVFKGMTWLLELIGVKTAASVAGSAAETAASGTAAAAAWAAILPWVAAVVAIAATIAIIWIFRDDIVAALSSVWNSVKNIFSAILKFVSSVFWALLTPVRTALSALVNIIQSAVKAAWKALQYLNPFMRHSPSLVDNVKAGVDEIARQYARLSNIGNIYSDAAAKLKEFGKATESIRTTSTTNERAKQIGSIEQQQPDLVPLALSVWSSMDQLSEAMKLVKIEIDIQAETVSKLESEYKSLGKVLDEAEYKLKNLERTSSLLRAQFDAAKSELSDWANRPIQGSKQLSDSLFENEMAQKRLRLEIMRIEDTYGSIDDVKNKMALLAGEVEQLQALQTNLRESGAGSEITDPIQQKIAQLRAESAALASGTGGSQISKLEEELKRLQREAERLDLEGAIQFDPMKRQIEELANVTREATFEEIIAGMAAARVKIDELTPRLSLAEEAARVQQSTVDELKTAHDELGHILDVEKSKLNELVAGYDGLKSMYDDLKGIMDDIVGKLDNISGAAGDASEALGSGDWEKAAESVGDAFNLDDEILAMAKGLEEFIIKWQRRWDTFVGYLKEFLILAITGGLNLVIAGITVMVATDTLKKIENMFRGVWNWIVSLIEQEANRIIGALNVVAGLIGQKIPSVDLSWAKVNMVSPDYGEDPTYGASPYGLHTGGIVPGVIGSDVPTVLQAGEGVLSIKMMRLIDRAISAPEQSMTSNSSSSKTINFYGDLSFPNISNSDDAEQFIRNLEAMAAS